LAIWDYQTASYPSNRQDSKFSFRPHPLARNPHFQTIFPSRLHKAKSPNLNAATREMVLVVEAGVRLQGFYSPQPKGQARGIVLLLHGWLGCSKANYMFALGEHLFQQGYSIFRLNFRDHGNTYQLNPGVFRADLVDEVFSAAQQVANLEPAKPFHIMGVSLGGNFALRLAWRHTITPLLNFQHTIAVNPPLNPYHTTLNLDHNLIYLTYFRQKWRRMLRQKAATFPGLYNFSEELAAKTCMAMTEAFVRRYSPYPDGLSYLNSYLITPAMMAALQTPVTILTAADDPVVPVADFEPFHQVSPHLRLSIQPYGGHVGFINIFPFRHWLTEVTSAILENQP
jgi:predicted alpha/beta-fold hydrolase